MLFADRLYKQCFHDGALSDQKSRERWMALCDQLDDAMICESARWGDAHAPYGPNDEIGVITRNDHWYAARVYVFRQMDRNAERLLIACRLARIQSYPAYPITDPPEFSQHGGVVQMPFSLTISAFDGDIYYTTNGTDPRAVGGEVAAGALLYTNAI
ncbi:MAG: chitobiase/beta-hexosaminidase C-terminal domain-containing protein, partial [Kiritimatiellaeota bacterium]|nr:chitobiase/beta-hexosaminidase C-terminal domain-containing protein [Kiritimatiellota bacterium]